MARKKVWQGLILVLSLVMALCIFGGCDGLNLDFSSTPSSGNHGSQDKDDENGGHGSKEEFGEDYVKISDFMELQNITDMSGKYVLTADIDGQNLEFQPLGSADAPFTGEFVGNGYKISNLTINAGNADTYIGMFAVNSGMIRGVRLEDLSIIHTHSSSNAVYRYIGGLAGRNNGVITGGEVIGRIKSSAKATGIGTAAKNIYVGGITGYNYESVSNCSFDGTVSSYVDSFQYSKDHHVGGIVGRNEGTVSKCLVSGSISNTNDTASGSLAVGGICGTNYSNVEYCLFTGSISWTNISPSQNIDAIGWKGANATQTACYKAYNVTTTGGNTATEEYLNSKSFYTDYLEWDETVWDLTNLNYAEGLYAKLR